MIARGLSEDGALFLDYGVSGNVLNRPGFDSFRRRAMGDTGVSHLFIPRRDRIARPDHADDGMQIERELRGAGLTLIFTDEILPPVPRGQRLTTADLITSALAYDASGRFRRELADKLIYAKILLAGRGNSIGGTPPYGFRRWLVKPDRATVRELAPGEVVKMDGHHVAWLPTAEAELAVVRRILGMIETTPVSRIARMLNDEGIPSPGAGRRRRASGAIVVNSGLWTQNSVRNIATHPLLIAIREYGRRAEGDQLRLTPTGPRALTEDDFGADGRPRAVANPADLVIRTPAEFEPILPVERRDAILRTLETRGRHLKGKPRTRLDSPNPLGGRIYDLGCGWLMYRHARRGRWGYQCGLYQNSQAKRCAHNVIEGEAATRFVLECLRQRVLTPTAMNKLRTRLEELADAEGAPDRPQRQREACTAELRVVERKLATVGQNLALAESLAQHRATATVFDELESEAVRLRGRLRDLEATSPARDPAREVEAAVAGLGRLHELAGASNDDLGAAGELFGGVNARLFLKFRAEARGEKTIQTPNGGVLTFGSTPPPGPLYDGPTGRTILRVRMAAGEPVAATPEGVPPGSPGPGPEANWSANMQRGTSRCSGPRPRAALPASIKLTGPWPGPLSFGVRRRGRSCGTARHPAPVGVRHSLVARRASSFDAARRASSFGAGDRAAERRRWARPNPRRRWPCRSIVDRRRRSCHAGRRGPRRGSRRLTSRCSGPRTAATLSATIQRNSRRCGSAELCC